MQPADELTFEKVLSTLLECPDTDPNVIALLIAEEIGEDAELIELLRLHVAPDWR